MQCRSTVKLVNFPSPRMGYRLSHLLYKNHVYKRDNVSVGRQFEATAERLKDKVWKMRQNFSLFLVFLPFGGLR